MKLFSYVLTLLLLTFSISNAYEELPEDAKEKSEDISHAVISKQAPEAKSRLGKNTILNLSGTNAEETNVVLVDKALKRLYIATLKGDDMEVIKEFPILTGRVDGNKIKRGDEKTPEGVYYVLSYTSGEDLVKKYGEYALIYGAGSFPLNYPNIVDRIEKKTGGGIWLHGVKPDLDKTYTAGCVAMNNTNFSSLYESVKITTPTIIAENLVYSDSGNYNANKEKLSKVLNDFTTYWQKNNKQGFKDIVHSQFRTYKGDDKKSYTSNKLALMDLYPDKVIRNMNTKFYMKDEKYTVIDTDQYYCAANLSTYNNKRYYFIEEKGSLKLISEENRSKSVKNVPNLDNEINQFVNSWLDSWLSQDINKYIGYYDKFFRAGKDNYKSWHAKKEAIFSKKENISVKISNITWYYTKGEYVVEFTQEYSSGSINDKGKKTLRLSGCPSFFKIKSETWREI